MSVKRIAFFTFQYPVCISPSIINAAQMFAKAGYSVDIVAEEEVFSRPEFDHNNIRVIYTSPDSRVERISDIHRKVSFGQLLSKVLRLISRKASTNALHLRLESYFSACMAYARENQPFYSVGFDREGGYAAYLVYRELSTPYCIYSLELNPVPKVADSFKKYMQQLETQAPRHARFTIIQDDARKKLYLENHNVDQSKFVVVPVGDVGPANTKKSGYLREKFGIPPTKKIVIYAGSITSWARTTEIAESVAAWPENVVFVIHGVAKTRRYIDEIMALIKRHPGRIFLSLDFVPHGEMNTIISSADIGVALYDGLDDNFLEIGVSSSKIALYTKNCLPIIASDFKSIANIVDKEGLGICIHRAAEMPQAMERIFDNYRLFSAQAEKAFYKYYDFAKYFAPVIEEIHESYRQSEASRQDA